MAIVFHANYSKKLGLPNYSSHQYSITIQAELADINQVAAESARLYALLQSSVDKEIKESGFLPEAPQSVPINRNGSGSGGSNGNGSKPNGQPDCWACSDKQKKLILDIVADNRLDKAVVEKLAQDMFSKGVKTLNKLEASGLITELLEKYPSPQNGQNRSNNRRFQNAGAR